MSDWIYKQTEPSLWTVGTMWRDKHGVDRFDPSTDHGSAEEAAARVRFLNGGGPVGVCGTRLHDSTGPYSHLFVCTKTPGHAQAGDPDHTDGTRHGAPAATWRDPVDDGVVDAEIVEADDEPVSYPMLGDPNVIVTEYPAGWTGDPDEKPTTYPLA